MIIMMTCGNERRKLIEMKRGERCEIETYDEVSGLRYLVLVLLAGLLPFFSLSKSSNCSRAARISDIVLYADADADADKKHVQFVV